MAYIIKMSRKAKKALKTENAQNMIRMSLHNIGQKLKTVCKQEILRSPKEGNWYYYKYEGFNRMTQASLEFNFPANQTGRLRRSIFFRRQGNTLKFGAKDIDDAKNYYPAILQTTEDPNYKGRNAGLRPFLTMTHHQVKPKFTTIMNDSFETLMG